MKRIHIVPSLLISISSLLSALNLASASENSDIEQLAMIAGQNASRIISIAEQDEELIEKIKGLATSSASSTEFAARFKQLDFARTQIIAVLRDEKTNNEVRRLGIKGVEGNLSILIQDIVYFKLLFGPECESIEQSLTLSLVNSIKKSSRPDTSKPEECFGEFRRSESSIIMRVYPYPYVFHFGICESQNETWIYDGYSGWHLPTKRESTRLCEVYDQQSDFCKE